MPADRIERPPPISQTTTNTDLPHRSRVDPDATGAVALHRLGESVSFVGLLLGASTKN